MATQARPKAVMGMASRSMLVRLSEYVIRILGGLYGRAQTNSRPPRHPSTVYVTMPSNSPCSASFQPGWAQEKIERR